EDHRLPIAGMVLHYAVGTRNDEAGASLLLPRALMHSSKHVKKGDYDRLLHRAGGTGIAWNVTIDDTQLAVTLPKSRVNLALWLWSDQMGFFPEKLDDEMIADLRGLVDFERGRTVESAAYGSLEELVRTHLYPDGH